MKKTILSAITILLVGFGLNAQQSEKATFTVYGNCGMCERTIEGAVGEKDGVSMADWDRETHQFSVAYDPEKIDLDGIKEKIAAKGYDSDTHRASNDVYDSLPGCCQYKRSEIKK
jgi:copper chaperone CopZ